MSFSADSPPAGWYPDPAGSGGERYWDGGTWSHVTRPAGGLAGGGDPYAAGHAPGGAVGNDDPSRRGSGYAQPGYAQPGYAQGGYGAQLQRQPMLAGFWWRVLASVLDSLVMAVPFGIIIWFTARGPIEELGGWYDELLNRALQGDVTQPPLPSGAVFQITVVLAILWILYRTCLVALKGATVGQLITGLRVVPDGAVVGTIPGWGTSALRAVAAIVLGQIPWVGSFLVLVMLFNAKKQTLHDMIARTVVIKK